METMKQNNNAIKALLLGGGILAGIVIVSSGVSLIRRASESEVEVVESIQVISPSVATSPDVPKIGQSATNRNIELADQDVVLAGERLAESVEKMTENLILVRAKRWLVFASTESSKQNKTESEFLTDRLLYFLEELKNLSNNGALDPRPDKMDTFYVNTLEVKAITMALTTTPPGGANTRVDVSGVLRNTGELYQKAVALNNAQRFGIDEMLNRPVENRQNIIEDSAKTDGLDETDTFPEEGEINEGN